jgi:hypothetical protein
MPNNIVDVLGMLWYGNFDVEQQIQNHLLYGPCHSSKSPEGDGGREIETSLHQGCALCESTFSKGTMLF